MRDAELESHRHRIVQLIHSVRSLLDKADKTAEKVEFVITLLSIDLLYARTNIKMYLSNIERLGIIYSDRKFEKQLEETQKILVEQKEIIGYVFSKLMDNFSISRDSSYIIQGGQLFNMNPDSIVDMWRMVLMYNEKIVREIRETEKRPFLQKEDSHILTNDPEIKQYLAEVSSLIVGKGPSLLTKEYHIADLVQKKKQKLNDLFTRILTLIDTQIETVKRARKSRKSASRLHQINQKEKQFLHNILEDDDLLRRLS